MQPQMREHVLRMFYALSFLSAIWSPVVEGHSHTLTRQASRNPNKAMPQPSGGKERVVLESDGLSTSLPIADLEKERSPLAHEHVYMRRASRNPNNAMPQTSGGKAGVVLASDGLVHLAVLEKERGPMTHEQPGGGGGGSGHTSGLDEEREREVKNHMPIANKHDNDGETDAKAHATQETKKELLEALEADDAEELLKFEDGDAEEGADADEGLDEKMTGPCRRRNVDVCPCRRRNSCSNDGTCRRRNSSCSNCRRRYECSDKCKAWREQQQTDDQKQAYEKCEDGNAEEGADADK